MKYAWRYTIPGDALCLRLRPWDHQGLAIQPLFPRLLDAYNYAFTALHYGRPYSVAGGYYSAPGVCDIFIMADESVPKHARHLLKSIREWLGVMEDEGVRRFQAAIPVDLGISCRLLEHLGFDVEAQLDAYFPDSDAYLFSKVSTRHGRVPDTDRNEQHVN